MPNFDYDKRGKKNSLNKNSLLMLAETSLAAVTDENNDASRKVFHSPLNTSSASAEASRFDVSGHPNSLPLRTGHVVQIQTFPTLEENPTKEMHTVIRNIIPSSSQPRSRSSFSWNMHNDKVLIDYCSYFLNSDGSIGDDKWLPLAHELGTSAASCRMRWHVLKGSASQATWEQQQQYLHQKLSLSIQQQTNYPTAPHTNDKPARTMHSSHQQQHLREEEYYYNPEFDAYLQQVLWEDDDFVRAVNAIRDDDEIRLLLESQPPMRVEI
jgi:hypothetical protein